MDLISVIVPVYKVEPFLKRCVESITNQTFKNLEIILVDDGSPDKCPLMCDEFAQKDSRIKVYHKENGGLSDARNFGIRKANGNYITFVDSDDWLEINFIETILTISKENNADIVISDHLTETKKSKNKIKHSHYKVSEYSAYTALKKLVVDQPISFIVAWGKLYKREIFNHVVFPIHKFHEDEATCHKFFFYSKKIIHINSKLYHYNKRKNSITTKPHYQDALEAIKNRVLFFKEQKLFELYQASLPSLCCKSFQYAISKIKIFLIFPMN